MPYSATGYKGRIIYQDHTKAYVVSVPKGWDNMSEKLKDIHGDREELAEYCIRSIKSIHCARVMVCVMVLYRAQSSKGMDVISKT